MNSSRQFGVLLLLSLLLTFSLSITSVYAADFQGSIKARLDTGQEVNTQSGLEYPDNLMDRTYFESLLTAEVHFKKIPVGKRLRLGIR
ncbi:hypothetical protein KKA08_03320, partial [bacterium]|nr:hypothetical protein [bacterium]